MTRRRSAAIERTPKLAPLDDNGCAENSLCLKLNKKNSHTKSLFRSALGNGMSEYACNASGASQSMFGIGKMSVSVEEAQSYLLAAGSDLLGVVHGSV